MEYIVSARKYRPANFQSVVGQGSITQTLKNAVREKRIAHSYLFCGPRGVGKTTCSRIFAKTINCSNLSPDIEPCNECDSCRAFNENRSFNIHELDAASNNSVDDIRSLIDSVRVPPQVGSYSVYIIDEVHMLSQAAFNAFLKTLEEPPAHAVFILATTEKHKILPTIISRCQVFDFHRITVPDVVEYLKYVAGQEGISAEDEALTIIGQKADGAMRDALSIFDQIVAFSGKEVTYKKVVENLNILDYEVFFSATDAIKEHDYLKALLILDDVLRRGFDALNFLNGLTHHLRNLLVAQKTETSTLLDVSGQTAARYTEQSAALGPQNIIALIEALSQSELTYRTARDKRQHVEFALLHACMVGDEKKKVLTQHDTLLRRNATGSTQSPAQTPEKQPTTIEPQSHAEARPHTAVETNSAANFSSIASTLRRLERVETPQQAASDAPIAPTAQVGAQQAVGLQPMTEIDPIQLNVAWQRFYSALPPSEMYLRAIMSQPPKCDGNKVIVLITDPAQKMITERTDLVAYLRKELGRKDIVVTTEEDVNAQNYTAVPYTSRQKLEVMIGENNNLQKLFEMFDLDLG